MTRYPGSNTFTSAWNGRGVLIVTGAFHADNTFLWERIVLAGSINTTQSNVDGRIRGMLVLGLNGDNTADDIGWRLDYSCNVYKANESISYLELIENTVFEVN